MTIYQEEMHRCRTQRFHHSVVTERAIRIGDESK